MARCAVRFQTSIERLSNRGEIRRAIIAVNDDVGDGNPIDLRTLEVGRYLRNPVVQYAHEQRKFPVGETVSLELTHRGWEADFKFAKRDSFARDVKNLWDQGILRGASIGAAPGQNGSGHELLEWSIVNIPADGDAINPDVERLHRAIQARVERGKVVRQVGSGKDTEMDENDVARIVAQVLDVRDKEAQENARAQEKLAERMTDKFEELLKKQNDDFEKRMSEFEERMGGKKKKAADDEEMDEKDGEASSKKMKKKAKKAKKAEGDEEEDSDEMEEKAEKRAELLVFVRNLLPKDFEARGKSNHAILVAAAGEEVENAADQSEDYLRAKVEEIVKRRENANKRRGGGNGKVPKRSSDTGYAGRTMNMHTLRQMKHRSK